jgi:hypothetical protein
MSHNHSPGPWKMTHKRVIERPVRISKHFAIAPSDGPTFAFLPEGRQETQYANASLITAAPEMLEMLEHIERRLASRRDGSTGHSGDPELIDKIRELAMRATEDQFAKERRLADAVADINRQLAKAPPDAKGSIADRIKAGQP